MSDEPKVAGSPDRIWLVYGDIEQDCTHAECDEVTWCEDEIYQSDVEYVRLDIHDALRARVAELEAEDKLQSSLIERLGGLLTGVANAIKGPPPELTSWSYHDLPELAAALRAENARLRAALEAVQRVVNQQAEDGGLWFKAQTAPEAYLQQELRALHRVIEATRAEELK